MAKPLTWWRKGTHHTKESIGMLVVGVVTVGAPTLLSVLAMMMIQSGIT